MHHGFVSSLVMEVKEKHDPDPVLLQLKEDIHKQKVMVFAEEGDGVLRYKGRLCVLYDDGGRDRVMAEAHSFSYFIYPGCTKMYHDLGEVY